MTDETGGHYVEEAEEILRRAEKHGRDQRTLEGAEESVKGLENDGGRRRRTEDEERRRRIEKHD